MRSGSSRTRLLKVDVGVAEADLDALGRVSWGQKVGKVCLVE
jgi:hypothetical protein